MSEGHPREYVCSKCGGRVYPAMADDDANYETYFFRCSSCHSEYGEEWTISKYGSTAEDEERPLLDLEPWPPKRTQASTTVEQAIRKGEDKEKKTTPQLVNGNSGMLTERAVQVFQRDSGFGSDGTVGPQAGDAPLSTVKSRNAARQSKSVPKDAIFICYRREETADVAGRIYDRLCAQYDRTAVFKDVDSIPIGVNFKNYLSEKLSDCRVVLAIIGASWLSSGPSGGKSRLHDPTDFLRIEIESALEQGISVVPVLVQGASMPKPLDLPSALSDLAYIQGTKVRQDPDFHRDMDSLIGGLDRILAGGLHDDE
jgi:hypothetical protein